MDRGTLSERLESWVAAGLVTDAQAERIRDHEAGRALTADGRGARRAVLSEVVGYVGASFALGAVALLVAEFWSGLAVWARVALALLVAVLALTAGSLTHGRVSPALDRLTGVLWGLTVIAAAWVSGIVAWDVLAVPERWIPTAVGGPATLVAAVLLVRGRHVLVQLAGAVALGSATAGALVALAPLEPGPLAFGTLLVGGGATWALAGAGGWLGPRASAEATGAVAMLIGGQVLSASSWPRAGLGAAIVVALVLVAAAVPGGRVHLLYLGAFGLFVSVPRLVLDLFADTLGAPAALLLTGVLLILIAVGLTRVRRSQEAHHAVT